MMVACGGGTCLRAIHPSKRTMPRVMEITTLDCCDLLFHGMRAREEMGG
jgi:hypothetical protein